MSEKIHTVPGSLPTVRTMAMPKDTNWLGDVFGGWLMSHADIAGSILAYRRAGGKVVTVAIDDFEFLAPVDVGDIVTFWTRVADVGRSSVRVCVEMYAERKGCGPHDQIKVASSTIVYVHIGDDHRPRPVAKR